MSCINQQRHSTWNLVASGMGNFSPWWVPASFSIKSKDQTCNGNCVRSFLCDSDFLISLHWLQRETGKWSVFFRLPFPLAVTLFPKTSMCLPPQCDSVRWQVGLQSLKLLTLLHSHFQSITFCGWGSVNLSSFGQTGHWGEDVHSNLAVNLVPYGFSFTLCLQLGWDGGIWGDSFSPEEERITEIPPLEVLMGFYSLYLVP